MTYLLSIYQNDKEGFELFIKQVKKYTFIGDDFFNLATSYLPRTYLKYVRIAKALDADKDWPGQRRIDAMLETNTSQQLPVFWAQDPFMAQANAMGGGIANVHDFDDIYELDRPKFFNYCDEILSYEESLGSRRYTLYNNSEVTSNYQTNTEVEDFIDYLEKDIAAGPEFSVERTKITGSRAVSIIKQMLGLESKGAGVSGGFAPYLDHSMYYAKSGAPKGDVMLGRVWFYMKAISKNATDLELNQRSVILAILEAAEISRSGVNTHCQTRMTGELMKLIAWHLPDSKLRSLIAGSDLPAVASDADMVARITGAPERANQLFNRLKREDVGAIRTLLETNPEPELWQRYQAYYDDLYGRTRKPDGSFKKDEHVLMRDNRGNLVRLYKADGTPRPDPEIVYYQAEFQVFEQVHRIDEKRV